MEKSKIFSKLNIKNYNDELEKILETKIFSSDVKNLLLSMLYKIENAYKDYMTVKRETLAEKDFIAYIIHIIKEKCFEIELIDPDKPQEPKIDRKKGSILCHPNEKSILSALLYMGEEEIRISCPYPYLKEAMQEMLKVGSNINQMETIRDFNGWSWDSVVKEIENIPYNLLYQSLLMIDGEELLEYEIRKQNRKIFDKKDKAFWEVLNPINRASICLYIQYEEQARKRIQEIKKEKMARFELLKNKKDFVEKMAEEKRAYMGQIEEIDKIANSTELLKKEYHKRNALLPNKEKIFSISHLSDRLEKERNTYLENIKQCNKILEPREYVIEKQKVQEEVKFLDKVEIKPKIIEENLIEVCQKTLQYVKEEIEKVEEKNILVNWIYKVRYYRYVPFKENVYLKDVEKLEKIFKEVIGVLTKKAQEYKIWDIFSDNEELTYIVIKELFDCKMICLENALMECKYEKGILYVEYYDTNVLETKAKFEIKSVKIKKKIKLFI